MNNINDEIKKEADEILYSRGLFEIVNKYGKGIITGSYALGCMAWRDLDIYIINDNPDLNSFFRLGNEMALLLKTPKMNFRNELISHRKNLPEGLYWGIYFNNEYDNQWKIDIWMMSSEEYEPFERHFNELNSKMTDTSKKIIMDIKSQSWQHPKYRKEFTSQDIYKAVLDKNIQNMTDFKFYLRKEKGIDI